MKNYILFLLCFISFCLVSCASARSVSGESEDNIVVNGNEEVESFQDQVLNDISDVQKSGNYILQS